MEDILGFTMCFALVAGLFAAYLWVRKIDKKDRDNDFF